jgi:predicted lipoprotein with Yx(FWY)xxD motif
MFITPRKSLVTVLCIALTLNACKKKDVVETPIQKKGLQIATDAKFGAVLTDSTGRTLYMFSSDEAGTANCTGACETTWPVYYSANASTDLNVKATEVGIITRTDGKKQTTFKGYPLYFYKDDLAIGEIKGDGVAGIWFVAKPDYAIMMANFQLTGANGKTYLKTYVEGVGKTVYLTDDKGRTLYSFSPDKNNKNTFTTDLTKNGIWPVYEGELKSFPSVITKDLVAVIDVTTVGKKQLTFKGWPLYYYSQDLVRGDNKGVSIGAAPGFWPVLTLDKTVAPL